MESVGCTAPPPVKKGPSTEQIQQAIDDLSSSKFPVRERASKFLWEAGSAAEAALRLAAKSKDEETSNRAKAILEKFDWGLYPDTPPEVVKLIEKFRGGEPAVRQEAVGELIRMKPTRFGTLRKLISQEQDENPPADVSDDGVSSAASRAVAASSPVKSTRHPTCSKSACRRRIAMSLTDFAALQSLRNRVPEAIRRIEAMRKKSGPELEARRHVGDAGLSASNSEGLAGGTKAAEATKNKTLVNDVGLGSERLEGAGRQRGW